MDNERGWPPVTSLQFEQSAAIHGALFVGSAESIAEKIEHHHQSLGGIDRLAFQMAMASIGLDKLLRSIELTGSMKKMLG